jgi:hypothetical protein
MSTRELVAIEMARVERTALHNIVTHIQSLNEGRDFLSPGTGEETMTSNGIMTENNFRVHMSKLTVPQGFTGAFKEEPGWGRDAPNRMTFVLENHQDVKIVFDDYGGGHTSFKTPRGWLSFDRRGVEDSFYHRPLFKGDKKRDLNELVTEQLERVRDRQAYYAAAVPIPGIPFTVAPDGVEGLKERLKKGSLTFTPSGFGTGYVVSKRPQRGQQSKRATSELETFLGSSPLFVSTFDAD